MKKIPDNAVLAFKGVLHDVYQWDQEMFDGSTATFEAIKRRDSVTVVATTEGKILLNDEEQPHLDPYIALPGGLVDDTDASLLESAMRELKEETGYEGADWKDWFTSDVSHSKRLDWNNYFFIAKNVQKTSEPHLDAGERIETRFITFEEFLELKNDPTFRNKDLIPILEEASEDPKKKAELQELLFTTT